ncbi:hypothetical protein PT974_08952 [Cladobotryum mycophilum]|uniref:Uncharacterized protein n=1 Tax=Cladobotryum mycophilum TaxID=491253 RepID=A0ABR0SES9_9HYPO
MYDTFSGTMTGLVGFLQLRDQSGGDYRKTRIRPGVDKAIPTLFLRPGSTSPPDPELLENLLRCCQETGIDRRGLQILQSAKGREAEGIIAWIVTYMTIRTGI